MTGILEQIHNQNQQILAALQRIEAQQGAAAPQTQYQQPMQQYIAPPLVPVQQYTPQPEQPPAPPAGAVQGVSGDQLQALIMPHIDNVAIKEALGAAMRAAGINALPEAQPHQYGDLYARFQSVLAAHGVGPGATGPVATATASII